MGVPPAGFRVPRNLSRRERCERGNDIRNVLRGTPTLPQDPSVPFLAGGGIRVMSDQRSRAMDTFYPRPRKCLSQRRSAVTSNDSLRGSNGSLGASNGGLPPSNGSVRASNDSAGSSNGRTGGSNRSTGASSGSLPSSSDRLPFSNHSLPASNDRAPFSNDRATLSNHLNCPTSRPAPPAGRATAFTRN